MRIYFIGLGNTRTSYQQTLHNTGFAVLDALARQIGKKFKEEPRLKAEVAYGTIGTTPVTLLKPMTGMNESGEVIDLIRQVYPSFKTEELFIIYDDLTLAPGTIRFREGGDAGGHKGMMSIVQHAKTNRIRRCKLGVGPDPGGTARYGYVTTRVTDERWQEILTMADNAAKEIVDLVNRGGCEKPPAAA